MGFIDLKSQHAELRENINAHLQTVLENGQYILGPKVKEMESVLCALKPGDEVISSPSTFAATAEMIVLAGGVPVFVDIELDRAHIDAKLRSRPSPRPSCP